MRLPVSAFEEIATASCQISKRTCWLSTVFYVTILSTISEIKCIFQEFTEYRKNILNISNILVYY